MNEKTIICSGCGVKIQTDREGELGYAPKSSLQREVVICQRCFRLKHYNEVQDVSLTDDDFLHILNEIGKSDALIVKLVDIFDFNGSWLPGLHRFVQNNPVLLVGNKADLLPKSLKKSRLIHWMKRAAKELGLKPIDVTLISAKTGDDVDELATMIEQYRNGKDVYVVGCTNVGKSTFINRLIKQFAGNEDELITTSHFPGTTLDMIEIPLDDTSSLYDTPGIINHHQIAHYIDKRQLISITPRKEIKPIVFQLKEEQTLFFGGLARLDFVKGDPSSFICYFANELRIHRTKLEKADELYANQLGELLQPPDKETAKKWSNLVKHSFTIKNNEADIVFSGLGWVRVRGKNVIVEAYAPKGVSVSIREALI